MNSTFSLNKAFDSDNGIDASFTWCLKKGVWAFFGYRGLQLSSDNCNKDFIIKVNYSRVFYTI